MISKVQYTSDQQRQVLLYGGGVVSNRELGNSATFSN